MTTVIAANLNCEPQLKLDALQSWHYIRLRIVKVIQQNYKWIFSTCELHVACYGLVEFL